MKPSTRIEELYPGEIGLNNRMTEDEIEKAMLWRKITAIMDYLDEQAELLDTHTVKEPNINYPIPNSLKFAPDGTASLEFKYEVAEPSDTVKEEGGIVWYGDPKEMEEPTTPEKYHKCTCGRGGAIHDLDCAVKWKTEVKLPTSSYEVTCGRCEKSFKHSCGKVEDKHVFEEDEKCERCGAYVVCDGCRWVPSQCDCHDTKPKEEVSERNALIDELIEGIGELKVGKDGYPVYARDVIEFLKSKKK